jgi:membrane-bound lytic murein transglycosylase A
MRSYSQTELQRLSKPKNNEDARRGSSCDHLLRQNPSVVFFRIVGLNEDTEAIGAQGIPLSAARSIAIDKASHVFGTPIFTEAELPLASPSGQLSFRPS